MATRRTTRASRATRSPDRITIELPKPKARKKSPAKKKTPVTAAKNKTKLESPKVAESLKLHAIKQNSDSVKKSPVLKIQLKSLSSKDMMRNLPENLKESIEKSPTANIVLSDKEFLHKLDSDEEVASITLNDNLRTTLTPDVFRQSNISKTETETEHSVSRRSLSRRSLSQSISQSHYTNSEYSDNEDENLVHMKPRIDDYANYSCRNQLKTNQNHNHNLINLLILLVAPLAAFYFYLCSCNNYLFDTKITNSLISNLNQSTLQATLKLINYDLVKIFCILLAIVILLGKIPLGLNVNYYKENVGYIRLYFNTFATTILILIASYLLEFKYNFQIINLINDNYYQLFLLNFLLLIILSITNLFNRNESTRYNTNSNNNNSLRNFVIGYNNLPIYWNYNVKILLIRVTVIETLLIHICLFLKNINEITFNEFNNITVIVNILCIIYLTDLIVFEHHLTTSVLIQYEYYGFVYILQLTLYPFYNSIFIKYLYETYDNIEMENVYKYIIVIIFLIGLVIKRLSNKIKYNYRMNPTNHKFTFIETIPTFQGKRLLVTQLWNKIRQPNYFGDFVTYNITYLILFLINFNVLIVINQLFINIMLFSRIYYINKFNQQRYNASWTRYCNKVKYILLPYLY